MVPSIIAYLSTHLLIGRLQGKQNGKESESTLRFVGMANAGETIMTMIDISSKPEVFREATATGKINLKPETVRLIEEGKIAKGDPLCTARVAGILAAKKTSSLIPLCHPLPLTKVEIKTEILNRSTVQVTATVKTKAQTGVEMESLTAAAVSLLTIWDMVKQYEKDAEGQYPSTAINDIHVTKKIKKGVHE